MTQHNPRITEQILRYAEQLPEVNEFAHSGSGVKLAAQLNRLEKNSGLPVNVFVGDAEAFGEQYGRRDPLFDSAFENSSGEMGMIQDPGTGEVQILLAVNTDNTDMGVGPALCQVMCKAIAVLDESVSEKMVGQGGSPDHRVNMVNTGGRAKVLKSALDQSDDHGFAMAVINMAEQGKAREFFNASSPERQDWLKRLSQTLETFRGQDLADPLLFNQASKAGGLSGGAQQFVYQSDQDHLKSTVAATIAVNACKTMNSRMIPVISSFLVEGGAQATPEDLLDYTEGAAGRLSAPEKPRGPSMGMA